MNWLITLARPKIICKKSNTSSMTKAVTTPADSCAAWGLAGVSVDYAAATDSARATATIGLVP